MKKFTIALALFVCITMLAPSLEAAPVNCRPGQTLTLTLNHEPITLVCSTTRTWIVAQRPRTGTVAGSTSAMLVSSGVDARRQASVDARFRNTYEVVARDRHGRTKWIETIHNIVVTEGLNDVLTKYFKGSAYTAAWYVGLKGTGTILAADTAASHSGWTEVTAYTEANRPTLALGSAAAGSIDNTASKAVFSINANGTDVYGVFVASTNTKGGATGVLFGGANFGTPRSGLQSGDTLTVTITLTQATQ
jgi:hypothetical protein